MNANQARKAVTDQIYLDDNAAIVKIMDLIKKAVADKKFELNYYHSMNEYVQNYFKNLGYGVKDQQTGPNEYGHLINW